MNNDEVGMVRSAAEPTSASKVDDYDTPEVNEIGMLSLQVYQQQHAIADRLWAYFHQYSALMILLALLAVAFRGAPVVKEMTWTVVAIPIIGYAMFFIGNHASLHLTAHELQYLKGVAIAQTRLPLRTNTPGLILLFHVVMALMTLFIYCVSWWYALNWEK